GLEILLRDLVTGRGIKPEQKSDMAGKNQAEQQNS
ncbi:MAG: hypothetical protein RIS14_1433, partial [Pseudomonadota bacterium]